ncbi:hypothetical protein AQI95_05205 [Streptomyces yokosukanensis]|uniref:Uncharacterized protein n=1 Tax=Streptomyces yokosukanensis TaxID=67386 RepID=A0A101PCZ7_9ACTN|nr:hypothetical protein AQI95_05205 [Streptomyces yokosukanensis]
MGDRNGGQVVGPRVVRGVRQRIDQQIRYGLSRGVDAELLVQFGSVQTRRNALRQDFGGSRVRGPFAWRHAAR